MPPRSDRARRAPDQSDQPVCSPQVLIGCYDSTAPGFALEDLALWTESAALSRIGGAGLEEA